jgi:hypothetical protein
MLEFLRRKVGRRKLRLFACACCRRIWDHFDDERSRNAVEVAERYADKAVNEQVRLITRQGALEAAHNNAAWAAQRVVASKVADFVYAVPTRVIASIEDAARSRAWTSIRDAEQSVRILALEEATAMATENERQAQSKLLRDIFGNPFGPVIVAPICLAANVVAIAKTIYDGRRFGDMPILGDALEDAGCDNADILNHCRQPGEHVRGCWVVDLILGKS